jgi:hypothetical protein
VDAGRADIGFFQLPRETMQDVDRPHLDAP